MATFYGVGLGPGDPELITRKAARILSEVDWIFLPAGKKSGTSFARRIVASLELPETKFRPVSLCMSRGRQEDQSSYERVAGEIAAEVKRGKSAAWISEGDPLFYSTFVHVYAALRRQHPEVKIEIVPGVTSLQAAAAAAAMPVARLDERVAIVPAVYGIERLDALLRDFATVFFIKVGSALDRVVKELDAYPDALSVVYLENLGTPEERIETNLQRLQGHEAPYFSLLMVRPRRLEDSPSGLEE